MNSITSLVCLTTALVSLAAMIPLGESAEVDLQSYLDLPTTKQLNSDPFHQEVRRALLRAEVGPGSSKESVRAKLAELATAETTSSSLGHIYRDLLQLAELEDDYCSSELLDVFHSIMAQTTTEEGKQLDAAFSNYLKSFGPAKFAHCAAKENEIFKSRARSELTAFNTVFRRAFNVGFNCKNSYLYEQLSQFEPTRDAFNVPDMVKMARPFIKDQQQARSGDEFQVVDSFMRVGCKQLGEPLPPRSRLYKIISLNRFFGPRVEFETDLLLENEYHRLCLAWLRQRDALERNIRAQVVKKRWLGLEWGWLTSSISNKCA